jgi:hypothetical protein
MAMGIGRSSLKEKNNGRRGSFGSFEHGRRRGDKIGAVCEMKRKARRRSEERRSGAVILALAAGLFVVLLLIRMLVFVVGRHGR